MGQQASVPAPGAKVQVIGAGLSRTGTASFSKALEILLDGPVYHGGTQTLLGPESNIRGWMKLLSHWPPRSDSDAALVDSILLGQLDGFVATTDAPCYGLVPELARLYPDAKIICTVRDPDAWTKSMAGVASTANMWFLRFVLFPLPALRYFVDYIHLLRSQWNYLYGEDDGITKKTWNAHIAWLKKTIPEDRLMFFDVKEGWAPLCKALGKEIPDVPFPRINDGEAIDNFAKKHVRRGLARWAVIFATGGVAVAAVYLMRG